MSPHEPRDVITLRLGSEDPTAKLGADHFRRTYGLPEARKPGPSWVSLLYESEPEGSSEFSITIRRNEVANAVQGHLLWHGIRVPLFERPARISKEGQVLVWFTDHRETYPCVVGSRRRIEIGFDVFREVGEALTCRLMTPPIPHEDEGGEVYRVPFIDCYERILFECLLHAARSVDVPMAHKASWPEGRPFAVFASHDVDRTRKTFQYPYYFARAVRRLDAPGFSAQVASLLAVLRGRTPYWNFEKIMSLEERLGVRSTFFFLHETGRPRLAHPRSLVLYAGRYDLREPSIQRIIGKLATGGWEIGLHGSYRSFRDGSLLGPEKELLEGVLGRPVHGVRQHYLRLDVPRTLKEQERVALTYDSTVGFSDRVGFRAGTSFPFFLTLSDDTCGLLELPLALMDGPLFGYRLPWEVAQKIVRSVRKVGGVLVVDWHQRHFNRFEGRGYEELYRRLLESCRADNAWFATGRQIDQWWRKRDAVVFGCTYEESKLSLELSCPHETTAYLLLPQTGTSEIRALQATGAGEASIDPSGQGSRLRIDLSGGARGMTVDLSL
jgi:peptidoglycan/xylan/chitin deacetylase (PgdA/CDA1 family)